MKKLIFILSLLFIFVACENDEGKTPPIIELTAQDSIRVYKGNFISTGNAAVLKGDQFIYQVVMDSMAKSLRDSLINKSSSAIQPVVIKGKVMNNPVPGGYSQTIEIREILEIPETGKPTN